MPVTLTYIYAYTSRRIHEEQAPPEALEGPAELAKHVNATIQRLRQNPNGIQVIIQAESGERSTIKAPERWKVYRRDTAPFFERQPEERTMANPKTTRAEYAEYGKPQNGSTYPEAKKIHYMDIRDTGLENYTPAELISLLHSHGFNLYQGYKPEYVCIQFQKGVLRDYWSIWHIGDLIGRLMQLREDDKE